MVWSFITVFAIKLSTRHHIATVAVPDRESQNLLNRREIHWAPKVGLVSLDLV